jgi:CheY-like chemotaxis protein
MNTSTSLPTELTELLTKLTQQSDASRLVFSHLLVALSKAFFDPLMVLLDKVQHLRQGDLTPEQQKLCIAHIQQSSSELLAIVNNLINFSQSDDAITKTNNTIAATAETFSETELEELKGVRTLIIGDDNLGLEVVQNQLATFGLQCTTTNTADALAVLRAAENEHKPYQIAVINAQHFDHHVAYLARTIKASPQLNHVMLTLALATQLLGFEKERAYFGGFACILNLTRPQRLLTKLIKSWRGWSAKVNFSRAEIPLHQNQNRILLVEDDPIPQKVTQRQLAEFGYEIDVAPDGHSALKLLEKNQYGLVFMDVGLPDISGLEVTAEFRKRENSSHHTPIIGLTIYAMETDAQSGLEAGMDEYLTKPLMQDKLKEVLQQWLEK